MLERTQVYVDTSYLLASFYNAWETGARAQLEIDLPEVVSVLSTMVQNQLKQPVHRQFWYDGIPENGPHRYQRSLRSEPGVQLRAGQLIEWGDRRTQKAVDTRLVADMVIAALKGQVSDIVLVSGDADMLPGVEEAVAAGIRVHLYGFGWDSMSNQLRYACDTTTILDPREDFKDTMRLEILEGPLLPPSDCEEDTDATSSVAPDCTPEETAATELALSEAEGNAASDCEETTDEDANTIPEPVRSGPGATSRGVEPVGVNEQGPASEESEPAAPTPADAAYGKAASQGKETETPTPATKPASQTVSATSVAGTHAEAPESSADSKASATAVTPPSPATLANAATKSADSPAVKKADSETADSAAPVPEPADEDIEAPTPRPNPGMMARHRKLRSRYVPLPNEVWTSSGEQNPYDIGQQYAIWWFENAATEEQKDNAHMLSGGGLPPDIDRPLLQFACDTLHEYTLTERQRVGLRDGFHAGIRGILLRK